jgi:hypothetical protein
MFQSLTMGGLQKRTYEQNITLRKLSCKTKVRIKDNEIRNVSPDANQEYPH